MSLPRELRTAIYALALTQPNPLNLTRHSTHMTKMVRHGSSWRSAKVYKLHCSIVEGANGLQVKLPAKYALSIAVLQTTKTINSEALPVLLGGNTFIFSSAVVLHDFCVTLGAKAKALANVTVKDAIASEMAKEHLCVLSRVEHPATICIAPQTQDRFGYLVLCPAATWEMVKPIVWRAERPIKAKMSFRPEESIEAQRARIQAFRFKVAKFKAVVVGDGDVEVIQGSLEREERFMELVVGCWWKEASATGVRRKREQGGFFADLRGSKQARFM